MGACDRWRPAGLVLAASLALGLPSEARANLGDGAELRAAGRPLDPGTATPSPPPGGGSASSPMPPLFLELEPGEPDLRRVPLLPRVPMAPVAGWFLSPEPSASEREEQAEERLDDFLLAALNQDRLQTVGADPWYDDVARAWRGVFRPNQNAVLADLDGSGGVMAVLSELGRFAPGPAAPQGTPGLSEPLGMRGDRFQNTDPTNRRQAVQQQWWDTCNPLNAPTTWHRVDLRVTHNVEGELSASWVLRTSGSASLDAAAIEAVRSERVRLPAPPAAVTGERAAIRSDWAFEMGDVATYYGCQREGIPGLDAVATLSCVDDPELGLQCSFMGRGIIRTRIRLLAVIDGSHRTAAERRADRDRNPERPRP